MKKFTKLLSMLLVLAMVLSMVACSSGTTEETTAETEAAETEAAETEAATEAETAAVRSIVGKEYGTDYTSLYSQFGSDITIADVTEDEETGFAYITVDGVEYELGLDFLTMAMVYNCTVPEGGEWETEDDVYATWWKLYIQRWNYLLPEVPLYSNEYYDVYNAAITGVEENPTNPYWGPEDALVDWASTKDDNSIILGNTTELSGLYRYSTFGGTSPAASNLDIENMTRGMETVTTSKEGGYVWNDSVVEEHTETDNDDGTRTYTVKIKEGLQLSDGSAVTAKNYVAFLLAFSTPVAAEAAGKDHRAGMYYVGFEEFNAYTGPGSTEGTKEFSGVRLLDDYTYSVTVADDYIPYFYAVAYAGLECDALAIWLGDCDIYDDGNGCYLSDEFYAMTGSSYDMAAHIKASATNADDTYPYSGMYTIESYDTADESIVLKLNPYFPGNYEGTKPTIETVVYKRIISSTQLEDFKSGGVDILTAITGGDATDEAIALCEEEPDKYAYIHYSRAGYGKLAFRCDFGPAQFVEVRQAVAYCMDRAAFAKDFTGGYGGVVDGPYYSGSWMYQEAVAQGMILDSYATSVDSAIAVLEEGGWVYAADGSDYVEGVRYKKIAADEISDNDKTFQSKDGTYVTTQVGDYYYMPLVLNWYGTTDNEFSDLLMTGFVSNENITAAGMVVQYTLGDFSPMLDELYQAAIYGYYGGTPLYTTFNFATGFTSAVYDYSWNMTIDPSMYDDYSAYYIKDMADVYWLTEE